MKKNYKSDFDIILTLKTCVRGITVFIIARSCVL